MTLRQVCLQKAFQRRFQLKQQCLRIGARGVRKACCSERRCGHERRLARSWVGCFFHWILQACCQEKDETNTLLSRDVWEEKQRAQIFTGANSWETSALTSAHMVLCLESEKNTLKKRDELSKLTENFWTCCCLVTEMRSSAQGVLSFTMMRSRLCEEWWLIPHSCCGAFMYCVLSKDVSTIIFMTRNLRPWGRLQYLGKKVVSALCLSCQLKVLKHDCFFGWPASLLTGSRTGVCDVNWGDVN